MVVEEAGKTNRDKILETTITLLGEWGYSNVSMRDIAAATGIKASSIYNHFENKEAVLDAVAMIFHEELEKRQINILDERDLEDLDYSHPKEILLQIMTEPLTLLDDPKVRMIIEIVTEGQFYHEGIRDFLFEEMFNKPLRLIEAVLDQLKSRHLVVELPTDFLAAELQSVFVAQYYKLSLHHRRMDVDVERLCQGLSRHVDFFWAAAKK